MITHIFIRNRGVHHWGRGEGAEASVLCRTHLQSLANPGACQPTCWGSGPCACLILCARCRDALSRLLFACDHAIVCEGVTHGRYKALHLTAYEEYCLSCTALQGCEHSSCGVGCFLGAQLLALLLPCACSTHLCLQRQAFPGLGCMIMEHP